MYRYRVKHPDGVWSRWADWSTTSVQELTAESRKLAKRARPRRKAA